MHIRNPDKLLRALDDLSQQKTTAALHFEEMNSLEMAYLARWSVVESILKRVVHATACDSLRQQMDEWRAFLDEPTRKPPKLIRNVPTDPSKSSLPTSTDLNSHFASAPNLLELLDPDKKYRKKRNAIAHSAEAIGQKKTYEEYKAKVEGAIIELRTAIASAMPVSLRRADA